MNGPRQLRLVFSPPPQIAGSSDSEAVVPEGVGTATNVNVSINTARLVHLTIVALLKASLMDFPLLWLYKKQSDMAHCNSEPNDRRF